MPWRIYRLELVVFHPNKQLRFFCGVGADPVSGPGVTSNFVSYRRNFQQLQSALHRVLSRTVSPTESPTELSVKGDDLSLNGPLCSLELVAPQALRDARAAAVLSRILDYCDDVLLKEEWENRGELLSVFKQLKAGWLGKIKVEVSRRNLESLLAVLPIQPYWDVPGLCVKPPSEQPLGERSLLSNMGTTEMPVYCAQITYGPATQTCSLSEELLGYPVTLRAGYADGALARPEPTFSVEDDFYSFCYMPPVDRRLQYQLYGVLLDAVQRALSQQPGLVQFAPSAQSSQQSVFYVAYPITTLLGRRHLWHIYLRPDDVEATLEDLWTAWVPVHERLQWHKLHPFASSDLDLLDIAYAQAAIARGARQRVRSSPRADLTVAASELVCEHGHQLFPAESFSTGERTWRSVPNLDTSTGTLLEFGQLWQSTERRDAGPHNQAIRFDAATPWGTPSENEEILRMQRREHMVEQYRQFALQQMLADKEVLRARNEEILRTQQRVLTCLHARWSQELADARLRGMRGENWTQTRLLSEADNVWLDGKLILTAEQVADLLFGETTEVRRGALVAILLGGAQLVASRVLELLPLKLITHDGHGTPAVMVEAALKGGRESLSEGCGMVEEILIRLCEDSRLRKTERGHLREYVRKFRDARRGLLATGKPWSLEHNVHAEELAALREGAGLWQDYFKEVLCPQLAQGNPILGGSSICRMSLPLRVLFPASFMRDLAQSIEVFGKRTVDPRPQYNYFRLPLTELDGNRLAEKWTSILYRNFLVLSYVVESPVAEQFRDAASLRTLTTHLGVFGGRLGVAFRDDRGWHYLPDVTGAREHLITGADVPNVLLADVTDRRAIEAIREKLFGAGFNVNLFLSYDSWYMRDGG